MPDDDVLSVKSRLDIVDIVGDYVALRKAGQTHWGHCPFHSEKTPSFSVSGTRQTYHCFGCGRGGDVISFVMEIEHLAFREALERLALRAGVTLSGGAFGRTKNDGAILDIQLKSLQFFKESLLGAGGEAARAYLARRFINIEDIKRFEIGWAPSSWDSLSLYLQKNGFSKQEIASSGLVSQGERGNYDRFRGRIMFPIYSITDKLVGFGGRAIDGSEAKYLNSPESPLFNKRNNLYLLNKAKMSAREHKSLILVEGYLDAIRGHLKGYSNMAASLGTALTESQAMLIKRITGLCYICYDSDTAGQEAALRGMYVLQKCGVGVRIVRLSDGKDPDELLLKEDGEKEFQKCLDEALPLPVYHAFLRSGDIESEGASGAARENLFEGLASLPFMDVLPHLGKIGAILGMFPHKLEEEILVRQENVRGKDTRRMPEDSALGETDFAPFEETVFDPMECLFCCILWNSSEARSKFTVKTTVPFIKDVAAQNIVTGLLSGETPESLENRWRQMGDTSGMRLIAYGNAVADKEGLSDLDVDKIALTLKKRAIQAKISFLQTKMKKGIAIPSEIEEHHHLTKILKGGLSADEKR